MKINMNKVLNEFQIKCVYIFEILITIISLLSIIGGIWISLYTWKKGTWEPSMLFCLIFGIYCLSNVYNLHKSIISNNRQITVFGLICNLFSLGRDIFISMAYLGIFVNDMSFTMYMLLCAGLEIIIKEIIMYFNSKNCI